MIKFILFNQKTKARTKVIRDPKTKSDPLDGKRLRPFKVMPFVNVAKQAFPFSKSL